MLNSTCSFWAKPCQWAGRHGWPSLLQGLAWTHRRQGVGAPGKPRVKSTSRGEAAAWAVPEGSPYLSAPRHLAWHLKECKELTLRIPRLNLRNLCSVCYPGELLACNNFLVNSRPSEPPEVMRVAWTTPRHQITPREHGWRSRTQNGSIFHWTTPGNKSEAKAATQSINVQKQFTNGLYDDGPIATTSKKQYCHFLLSTEPVYCLCMHKQSHSY